MAGLLHQDARKSIDHLVLSARTDRVLRLRPDGGLSSPGIPSTRCGRLNWQSTNVLTTNPSGKSERRVLHNAQKVTQGPSTALDFDDPKTGDIICNNAEWRTHMSVVTSIFRMNAVLQRDSVKKRLKTDQGTGFLDYSYQLFRADDFLHLHRNYGCVALIGASE
ncbi:hypothetical protein PRNP1_009555 [Phytophthora ramorum]